MPPKYSRATSNDLNIGLMQGQTYPDLDLKNAKGENIHLYDLMTKNTIVIVQPGASHPGQWENADSLEAWKKITDPISHEYACAAGCTDHLLGFIATYDDFIAAGYNVIMIMSRKTPEQLSAIQTGKKSPFDLYTLTPESLAELERLQHPVFKFEGQTYAYRNTWVISEDLVINHCTDSISAVPEVSKGEAARLLAGLSQPQLSLVKN